MQQKKAVWETIVLFHFQAGQQSGESDKASEIGRNEEANFGLGLTFPPQYDKKWNSKAHSPAKKERGSHKANINEEVKMMGISFISVKKTFVFLHGAGK